MFGSGTRNIKDEQGSAPPCEDTRYVALQSGATFLNHVIMAVVNTKRPFIRSAIRTKHNGQNNNLDDSSNSLMTIAGDPTAKDTK